MNNSAIILAAGEGTRMKSKLPKTLAKVLNKPMLQWVIESVKGSNINNICVVKGYGKEDIDNFIKTLNYKVESVVQEDRLGTGHAVMMAKEFLNTHKGNVIVLSGDAPFMDTATISDALKHHENTNAAATVISANIKNPTGYGRIVRDDDNSLLSIIEQKDGDENTLKIKEVNSGAYWFNSEKLLSVLDNITTDNKAQEYYLTDAIKLLADKKQIVSVFTASSSDTVLGANDPEQLNTLNEIAKEKNY